MNALVRNYTDFEHRGSVIYGKELDDFPSNPRQNEQVLIKGVLWIYSMVDGSLTWFPMNNRKNSKTHTQGLPSANWNVQHGLGSQEFILGVYDSTGNLMSPMGITNITDDSFVIQFAEAETGRAVVFCDAEAFVPAINSESVNTGEINIANGAVVATADGLKVNGNDVLVLNSQGQADFGTL